MISYSSWLKLPIMTRHKLAEIFKIRKTGATEVVSNEVVKDGYGIGDIESAITKEALQAYLGSTQDNFQYLWEDAINKIEGKPLTVRETITAAVEEEPLNTNDEILTTEEIEDLQERSREMKVGAIPYTPLQTKPKAPKKNKKKA